MFKNTACATVILVSSSLFCSPERYQANKENLLNAIQKEDLSGVQKFIKRLGPIDLNDKNEFLQAAKDLVDENEGKISLTKSPKDLALGLSGAVLFVLSNYSLINLLNRYSQNSYLKSWDQETVQELAHNNNHIAKPSERMPWKRMGLALSVALGGGFLAYKGITKTSARGRLANAHSIMDILSKAALKDGQPQEAAQA